MATLHFRLCPLLALLALTSCSDSSTTGLRLTIQFELKLAIDQLLWDGAGLYRSGNLLYTPMCGAGLRRRSRLWQLLRQL